jgi:SAM-dependent methyltransferase
MAMGGAANDDDAIRDYYDRGDERERLTSKASLEMVRTRELLTRFLPPVPASVLDVGGGAGVYATWLAKLGYQVHLVDPMPLHVEQAQTASAAQPDAPFTAAIGDARQLAEADASGDVVLLLGPLYHLTERDDRVAALREARRVVRPGGLVVAATITRFASLFDGLRWGWLGDETFRSIVETDLRTGQHRNPDSRPGWFTTAYFHHPDEPAAEVREAGLTFDTIVGIEGPGNWIGPGQTAEADFQAALFAAREVESEPTLLGLSAHLLTVAHRTE